MMLKLLTIALVLPLLFVTVAWGNATNGNCAGGSCTGGSCTVEPAENAGGCTSVGGAVARVVSETPRGRNLGSGTLVKLEAASSDPEIAYVLTCGHLFETNEKNSGRITVFFPDGSNYTARLLGVDRQWDLAVLWIARPRAVAVTIATDAPRPGQWLSSCGYGSDGRYWCNRGQARGYVRAEGTSTFETLELSGMARQGDSGGPVFNQQGELVAVLWGTNGRIVGGTYCGRIRMFLDRVFGPPTGNTPQSQNHEPRNTLPVFPDTQRPVVPIRRENENDLGDLNVLGEAVGLIRQRLDGLETRLDETEFGEKARAAVRDVARDVAGQAAKEFLATHTETSVSAWMPGLMAALGWTGPPAIAATIVITVLGRLLRKRVKKQLGEEQRGGTETHSETKRPLLNDSYAAQLADVFALSGHSPTADATLGREYDAELRRAEKSSDGALASWAKAMRERVAQRFYRIHNGQPMPADPVNGT